MITAYRNPGRVPIGKLIKGIRTGVPKPPAEVAAPGRTLTKRVAGGLAYSAAPGPPSSPTRRSTDIADACASPLSAPCPVQLGVRTTVVRLWGRT
ncbi:hypothetical protein AB0D38_06475, partial [Streptomyces sp. NPDC048279]